MLKSHSDQQEFKAKMPFWSRVSALSCLVSAGDPAGWWEALKA